MGRIHGLPFTQLGPYGGNRGAIASVNASLFLRSLRGRYPGGIPELLRWRSPSCPRQPRRAASMVATSIFFIGITQAPRLARAE
jgi:hypothetical protein